MKNFIINILGGYPANDVSLIKSLHESEKLKLETELAEYKKFAESAYKYVGSYPAWKAQQEYREAMLNLGFPISTKIVKYPTHEQNVDLYLGRIVDSFVKLFERVGNQFGDSDHWGKEALPSARGDYYLCSEPQKKSHL